MERKKQPRLVITFHTTTDAMRMEAYCTPELGRLIPVPRDISAGCGLAWSADPQSEDTLLRVMAENKIKYQEKKVVLLY
mgnify:CR=1 FL=1